jgi:hypothetical protein
MQPVADITSEFSGGAMIMPPVLVFFFVVRRYLALD